MSAVTADTIEQIAAALTSHLVSLTEALVEAHTRGTDSNAIPVPPAAQTDPLFWTIEDVAQEMQYSKTRVYQMARAGEIPARKIDSNWRFIPSEVRAWALALPDGQS